MTTTRSNPLQQGHRLGDPLHVPAPDLEDHEGEDDRRRPWLRLLIALLAAIIAIYLAGHTAARMWLEDLDARLFDAGAGTNALLTGLEREHLEAYRSIAFADGFAASLERYDALDIEARVTPIDANHGIPMIDIIDDQTRVVFAFRAQGAIRPVYRDRRDLEVVRQALAGEQDEYGERFTELIATDEGPLIATAGPIREGDRIVGALLLMTPIDEFLSQATNDHGAFLTAYSLDRGDPLATTTPIRPRSLGTELRTDLAIPENHPYATRFKVGGKAHREQIAAVVVRHRTAALLGAALPDRSREVARAVMLITALGMAVMAGMVATVAYAWARDRFDLTPSTPEEPRALPAGPPPPDTPRTATER